MNDLFENWAETKGALLEGLDSEKQAIVAPLLENQKNQLLSEDAAAGATSAHDIAGFRKILIPMIRRIMPGTIATELVGVQPMTGPVGLVYSLRYRYAEAMAHDPARSPFGGQDIAVGDEAFGNVSPIRSFYSGGTTGGTAGPDGGMRPGASGIGAGSEAPGDIDGTATGVAWPTSLDAADTSKFGPFADPGSAAEAARPRTAAPRQNNGALPYQRSYVHPRYGTG